VSTFGSPLPPPPLTWHSSQSCPWLPCRKEEHGRNLQRNEKCTFLIPVFWASMGLNPSFKIHLRSFHGSFGHTWFLHYFLTLVLILWMTGLNHTWYSQYTPLCHGTRRVNYLLRFAVEESATPWGHLDSYGKACMGRNWGLQPITRELRPASDYPHGVFQWLYSCWQPDWNLMKDFSTSQNYTIRAALCP
jgi:hypothetical protein